VSIASAQAIAVSVAKHRERIMRRYSFLSGLAATAGCCLLAAAPAFALDEKQLGDAVFADLRDGGDILFDSPYYEHLNEVGEIIARTVVKRYPIPIRYYIVKGDSANAFSVPGGNIYVNEPLIELAKNRDELGGVLAHETGHMVLHHVAKEIRNEQTLGTIGAIAGIFAQIVLGPLGGAGAQYALGTAVEAQGFNLSRHVEAQADEEGARIAAATGILNPYGLIWFFQTMTEKYGDKGTFWLRDHPYDDARITDLEHLFAANPQTFGKFQDTKGKNEIYW
jgi:beta-barrel assembly-enhancing protease